MAGHAPGGGFGGGGGGAGGANLAPGATVFFHLPADYDGSTPATLSFTTASGTPIRSFTLHPKTNAPRRRTIAQSPPRRASRQEERLTAVEPGMNRFQWDLRYPNAADVKGIFNSGFSAGVPVGPEVVPGTYDGHADLQAAPRRSSRSWSSSTRGCRPRRRSCSSGSHLLMRLHDAVNRLDTTLNEAIDARDALQNASADGSMSGEHAQTALSNLNRDIDDLVDLKIQSGEGALVYPGRLRSWLTAIAGQVEMAFVAPTPAMVEVANGYIKDAGAGVARLQSDIAATRSIVP